LLEVDDLVGWSSPVAVHCRLFAGYNDLDFWSDIITRSFSWCFSLPLGRTLLQTDQAHVGDPDKMMLTALIGQQKVNG